MKRMSGFSLTEVLIALSVLAFALVPLMGVMWSGVKRTDISATYQNAGQIGASILEAFLDDGIRFDDLDFSNPNATVLRNAMNSKESSGLQTTVVGANDFLGDYCVENAPPSKCQTAMSKDRYFKIGRNNFYTDLYIGAYYTGITGVTGVPAGIPTSMSWSYLVNPAIDYESVPNNPQLFYDTMILPHGGSAPTATPDGVAWNWLDWSPYYHSVWTVNSANHTRLTKVDSQISLPMDSPATAFDYLGVGSIANAQYANLAKIQLFIRWGMEWVANDDPTAAPAAAATGTPNSMAPQLVDARGKAKMIELVTFKGRLK